MVDKLIEVFGKMH